MRKQQVVRAALSAAAEKLFLSRGFEKITVEQIARTAGVSRRTLFRCYESKEDVMVERSDRLGERIAALMARRPGAARNDNTPMLLAFVTRALPDTAFTAWYDHETDNIAGPVDDLVGRLCAIVAAMPAKFTKVRK